ncbi:MAG: hypothetical protein Q9170_001776 [Blastenia crenularia]
MFDNYSITTASQSHDLYIMEDDVSPTSSRATTPTQDEIDMIQSPLNMDMVTELSNRFQQHRLTSCTQEVNQIDTHAFPTPTIDIEPPSIPLRASRQRSSSLLRWQQRQSMARRQCTPAHLSQISKLVEELSQDANPCYNATHPSSDHGSLVSPTSNPSSCSSFESTPSSSGSEDCGLDIDCAARRVLATKVSKHSRRGAPMDPLERKQKLVMKKGPRWYGWRIQEGTAIASQWLDEVVYDIALGHMVLMRRRLYADVRVGGHAIFSMAVEDGGTSKMARDERGHGDFERVFKLQRASPPLSSASGWMNEKFQGMQRQFACLKDDQNLNITAILRMNCWVDFPGLCHVLQRPSSCMMTTIRAASTVTRTAKNVAECSVYIRISPRPRNLAESREVLRVLQQYGEVVMYRHLKYEAPNPTPNAALAIYKTKNAAKDVVNASPIRFQLQQGSNGWVSKISQDSSSQGRNTETKFDSTTQAQKDVDQGMHEGFSTRKNMNGLGEEIAEDESEFSARYPSEDASEIKGYDFIEPKKGGRHFLDHELELESNDLNFSQAIADTRTTETASSPSNKNHTMRSARRLAEELNAYAKSSRPTQGISQTDQPTTSSKEFRLEVAKSIHNHQAYIERQAYYAGFNPDTKTVMAEDLKGRVPLQGFLDCSLNKPDVPLRVRLRRKETARAPISLMGLWEKGRRERGEV